MFASAGLSAVIFLILEFTVILPLFTKIVKRSVNQMVSDNLLPSVSSYIDEKITSLKADLVDSIFAKISGRMGGRTKGVNRIMQRLANGETLEEIEDEYQESTIDQVLTIVSAVASRLPDPPSKKEKENGEKKDEKKGVNDSQELLPLGSPQEGKT